MPTLLLDASFVKSERVILSKTFKTNCRDLGISKKDATIAMRRGPIGPPGQLGGITRLSPDYYVVAVNSNGYSLSRACFALGHELVHYDQYQRGDLIDELDNEESIWMGKSFPRFICESPKYYSSLPWEVEAARKHHKLFESAVRSLNADERETLFQDDYPYQQAA